MTNPSSEAMAAAKMEQGSLEHRAATLLGRIQMTDANETAKIIGEIKALRAKLPAMEAELAQRDRQISEGYKSIANMAGVMRELKQTIIDRTAERDGLRLSLESICGCDSCSICSNIARTALKGP